MRPLQRQPPDESSLAELQSDLNAEAMIDPATWQEIENVLNGGSLAEPFKLLERYELFLGENRYFVCPQNFDNPESLKLSNWLRIFARQGVVFRENHARRYWEHPKWWRKAHPWINRGDRFIWFELLDEQLLENIAMDYTRSSAVYPDPGYDETNDKGEKERNDEKARV